MSMPSEARITSRTLDSNSVSGLRGKAERKRGTSCARTYLTRPFRKRPSRMSPDDRLRLEAESHRELRRAVRPVHIEPLREDLVERLFERSPNGLARRIDGLLDASARHQVRPFELPQGLVQRILLPFRLPKEFLVGERFFLEEGENFLFRRLQAGPLCVDRDVVRYVVLRRPMDALRRPDTLDQSFVHKLAGPFSNVGEGCGRDVEHVPTLLLQKVRVTYAIQVRQDVFLPGDLRELSSEVLDDLSRLELDRTDLVRGHHALQDLAVQLPQEGGAVLHEDQVRDALQDDVVGERRGQRSEVALRHRDFPCLDPPEDFAGVVEVHDLVEDLFVR